MTEIVSQPAWLAHAWAELGEREIAGSADNPRIRAFFRDAGHPEVVDDEVAWCAAFTGACLKRSGIAATGSLMARDFLRWGEEIDAPRLGAIAVLSRSSDPAAGHVAFWIGESGDSIFLLGGNQTNAVSVAPQPRSRLLGYRWPQETVAAAATSAPAPAPADDIFERALAHVLDMEGGYSNDPQDPGGPTNLGITLEDYARFKHRRADGPERNVLIAALQAIGNEDVREIYDSYYWRPSHAAELPPGLAVMHFDAAVNHGLAAAARLIQTALGVAVDGEIGPLTLAAARTADEAEALERYAGARRARYRALPHFPRFGRGWLRRVDETLALSRSLAAPPAQAIQPQPNEKEAAAMTTDAGNANATDSKWWGHSMTIWGAIITSLATVVPAAGPIIGVEIEAAVVRQLGEQAAAAAQAVAGLIGTAMTVYGRARASRPLERRELRLQL